MVAYSRHDSDGGHDIFLVANVIHYWSPEDNVTLLLLGRRHVEHHDVLGMIGEHERS